MGVATISLAVTAFDMLVKIEYNLVGDISMQMLAAVATVSPFFFVIFVKVVPTDLFRQFLPTFREGKGHSLKLAFRPMSRWPSLRLCVATFAPLEPLL